MRATVFVTLLCLFCDSQSYRIVPKHNIQDGPTHTLKVFFSTQIVEQTRTVVSTFTQSNYNTCYATEVGITNCHKKRDLGESNDNTETSLVASDPKVEVNGLEVSWESIISPSRVNIDTRKLTCLKFTGYPEANCEKKFVSEREKGGYF